MRQSDTTRGQSLVEFALILPIMMLLLAGLFDLGHVVFVNNSLSDGAKHGARQATIDPRSATYCADVQDAIESATRGQGLTANAVTYRAVSEGAVTATYIVCMNGGDGPDKTTLAGDPSVAPGDRVTVELSTDVDVILGFIAQATGRDTFNLNAESTMQVTFAPED
jgi:Flp pilus assembly protein TadG